MSAYVQFWQHFSLHLNIGGPHNHVLELIVFPSVRRALYHRQSRVVLETAFRSKPLNAWCSTDKLIILDVQKYQFWPEMCLLCSFDDLDKVCLHAFLHNKAKYNSPLILIWAMKSLRYSITEREYPGKIRQLMFSRLVFAIQDRQFCEDTHLETNVSDKKTLVDRHTYVSPFKT